MTEFRIKPFILIALGVLAVSYGVLVFDDDTVVALGTEDGLFECATSVLFAITGGLLAWMYVKCPYANDLLVLRTRRNIFFLLLALVFLFGAGEEISWGQRIFGFETPESIEAILLAARQEGLLLDPVYTGKALAGAVELARSGAFNGEPAVFLHTGGTPALFGYRMA
jgi:hypothetical protein